MFKNACQDNQIPLIVDLDGTIIKTDLLFEMANQFIMKHPFQVYRLIIWLFLGKAVLKSRLTQFTEIDLSSLPYHSQVMAWLQKQKSSRRMILATASDRQLAISLAAHLDLFDEVIASEENLNLKGKNKQAVLIRRFGQKGYDYIGNESIDLPIWKTARQSHIVSSNRTLIAKVGTFGNLDQVFTPERPALIHCLVHSFRCHQWIKNILIFVPLLTAHQYGNLESVRLSCLAFFIFCLTASSVYLFNDLSDISNDRYHLTKRNRPFAAGNLSLLHGWIMFPLLLLIACALALSLLTPTFTGIVGGYFLLTLLYSLWLKRKVMIDVLSLAGLYTLRIIAGAAAIGVPQSFWLLTFSLFLFLSLALIKRFCEIKTTKLNKENETLLGRGYIAEDMAIVSGLGITSGYISVVVLALYIQDDHLRDIYLQPYILWLACPLFLYWISRIWLITHRGQMHSDPIVFSLKDKPSWIIAGLTIGLFVIAHGFR